MHVTICKQSISYWSLFFPQYSYFYGAGCYGRFGNVGHEYRNLEHMSRTLLLNQIPAVFPMPFCLTPVNLGLLG